MVQQPKPNKKPLSQILKLVGQLSAEELLELRSQLDSRTWGERFKQLVKDVAEDSKDIPPLTDEEIAYVGDDFPDLPILKRVGLAITVPNANALIKQHAHWTTTQSGGHGAVREICDLIMQAQGTYQPLLDSYLR